MIGDAGSTVGAVAAVFETLEIRSGRPFALEAHLTLLSENAAKLDMGQPDLSAISAGIVELAEAWGRTPGRLRITWSADGRPLLTITDLRIPTDAAVVGSTPVVVNRDACLAGVKSSWFSANVAAAVPLTDADEVLLANDRGHLCEGGSSNIFVGMAGRLITPSVESGCRAGVTRELVIEALGAAGIEVLQTDLAMAELRNVDEAFLTSTGRHVQAIRSIDQSDLVCPGPLTTVAMTVFDQLLA